MPLHFQPFIRPLKPQVVAPLPTEVTGLNEIPLRAQPGRFSRGDSVAPVFVAIVAAVVSCVSWAQPPAQAAVVTPHAKPDFVAQVKPTLATLPTFGSAPTIGANAVQLRYAQSSDFVAQVRPTLATLPTFGSAPTIGANAVELAYQQGPAFVSPDKFGILAAATPTIASWTATSGLNGVTLRYARPDFVAQVAPTLATLPTFGSAPTIGANSVTLLYARAPEFGPPSAQIVSPFTLSSWISQPGQPVVALSYARPDFVAQVAPTLATLPTFGSAPTIGAGAVHFTFALPENLCAPAKALAASPEIILLDKWRQLEPAPLYAGRFLRADVTAPPTAAVVSPFTLSSWLSQPGQPIVPVRFRVPEPFSAPAKVVVPAAVTLIHWRQAEPAPTYVGRFWKPEALARCVVIVPRPTGPQVICSQGGAIKYVIEAQSGGVKYQIECLGGRVILVIEALDGSVVMC